MAAQRDFDCGREPADRVLAVRRHDERGLRKVVLQADRLHHRVGQPRVERTHCGRIAAEDLSGEGIDLIQRNLHARRASLLKPDVILDTWMSARIWLGAMGWQEKDWVGPFYPVDTTPKDMLAQYGRSLSSVEVDSSFYGRPRATTVDEWNAAAPADFRFSLKVPREVTHKRRFKDVGEYFGFFVERVRSLGPKLGAILMQCPPDFGPSAGNRSSLFEFIDMYAPRRCKARARAARRWLVRRCALCARAREARGGCGCRERTFRCRGRVRHLT